MPFSGDLTAELMLGGVTDHSAQNDGYRAGLTKRARDEWPTALVTPDASLRDSTFGRR